jgi:hypothetical protein
MIYVDSCFQRFWSKISWIHCFGPKRGQSIMAATAYDRSCYLMTSRKQRGMRRGRGQDPAFQGSPQSPTYSNQAPLLPFTTSHLYHQVMTPSRGSSTDEVRPLWIQPLPKSPLAGTSLQHMSLWGHFMFKP